MFFYIFLVAMLVVSTEFHVYSQGISCKSRIGTTVVYIRVKCLFWNKSLLTFVVTYLEIQALLFVLTRSFLYGPRKGVEFSVRFPRRCQLHGFLKSSNCHFLESNEITV